METMLRLLVCAALFIRQRIVFMNRNVSRIIWQQMVLFLYWKFRQKKGGADYGTNQRIKSHVLL